MMFEAGDFVKWMRPMDPEYSYGKILRIEHNKAFVKEIGGYYAGKVWRVYLSDIRYWVREAGKEMDIVNNELLRMNYSEPKNIKSLLRNWTGLESLCLKGDTVATCILMDLKRVTGIDLERFDRHNRRAFNRGYKEGYLSYYQFMSIAYTLVLGYSQEDIAYVMGVDQSAISKNIRTGIKRIIRVLEGTAEWV